MRRPSGAGSIYQRKDGRWIASFRQPDGRRMVVSAKERDLLIQKLTDRHGIQWDDDPARPPSRSDRMVLARELGTHSNAEWRTLCANTPTCRYCGVELTYWNESKDHAVPIALGGSDAIDNIQRICWECNFEKGDQMPGEYQHSGCPRGVSVHPLRRAEWENVQRMAEKWMRNHG